MVRNEKVATTDEELEGILQARQNTDAVPILKRNAEDRIRRKLRDVAMKACSKELGEFAECAKGRTLSIAFACRQLNKAVDTCMKTFANEETIQDELRRRFVFRSHFFLQAIRLFVKHLCMAFTY